MGEENARNVSSSERNAIKSGFGREVIEDCADVADYARKFIYLEPNHNSELIQADIRRILLRRGFELALANAYTFAGTFPLFVNMSDVDFRAPVEVGDLLRFSGNIIQPEPDEFNKETLELKETNVYESGDDIETDIDDASGSNCGKIPKR